MVEPLPPSQIRSCDGCGADIYWVEMESGKRMPLDTKKRLVVTPVTDAETGRVLRYVTVTGYESHWATCPSAQRFRK